MDYKCPHCGGPARRETDTMPNWAGSSWYFLRYIDPQNERQLADPKKLNYWMPVDVYFGGAEHTTLHLLYSRFWHKFLNDIGVVPGKEPYQKRVTHGVVLGPDGQKMSKSRGNVINPDEVWQKHGVDALRTYLMFMGPYEGTTAWNDNALQGVARFLKRFEEFIAKSLNNQMSKSPNRKAKVALNKLIKKVSEDIDNCSFNTAIAAMMEFLNQWSVTSDQWSVEELKKLVQLIAPFAPYLAEELWSQLHRPPACPSGRRATDRRPLTSVHLSSWPKPDPRYLVDEEVEIIVQVNGKLRAMIKVAADQASDQKIVEDLAKKATKVVRYLEGKKIKKVIFIPNKLINFVV